MSYLLTFMEALKDNFYFVLLIAVLCSFITAMRIISGVRASSELDHQERIERARLDHARAIVPVKRMEDVNS